MREARHAQYSLTESFSNHETGQQLKQLSDLIDQYPELVDLVHKDLTLSKPRKTGCKGLTSDTVLRCLLIKQLFQFSYEKMASIYRTQPVIALLLDCLWESHPVDQAYKNAFERFSPTPLSY